MIEPRDDDGDIVVVANRHFSISRWGTKQCCERSKQNFVWMYPPCVTFRGTLFVNDAGNNISTQAQSTWYSLLCSTFNLAGSKSGGHCTPQPLVAPPMIVKVFNIVLFIFLLAPTTIAELKRLPTSACPYDRTKTAESTNTKLAAGIVYYESSPTN